MSLTFADVDVVRALEVAPRVTRGIERLWIDGRLRNLMRLPEGEHVARTFTEGHLGAIDQLQTASREGRRTATISIRTSKAAASGLVAFARRLYEMLADPAVMREVAAEPLTAEDLAFVEPFLGHAEAVVAQYV